MTPAPAAAEPGLELYWAAKGQWIPLRNPRPDTDRSLLVSDPRLLNIPENHTVLTRRTTASGSCSSSLGQISHQEGQSRLDFWGPVMPSDPGDDRRRQDFRIDGVDTELVRLRVPGMPADDPDFETEIDDVSAGGIGLVVPDSLLQKLREAVFLHLKLNLSLDHDRPDLLAIDAELRNVRALDRDLFHLGLQFMRGRRSEADVNRDTTRLLRYVAQRQRELLRRRPRLTPPGS